MEAAAHWIPVPSRERRERVVKQLQQAANLFWQFLRLLKCGKIWELISYSDHDSFVIQTF